MTRARITAKPNAVYKSRVTPSFFWPSRYNIIGLPRTNDPVIGADKTNSSIIIIGIKKLLSSLPKILWALFKKVVTAIISLTPKFGQYAKI